jgi:hypothetical protein
MTIITADLAEYVLRHILNEFLDKKTRYQTPKVVGYYKEGETFTCFDNTTWDCWVEQTKSREKAIRWCLGEIEVEDL